MEESWHWKKRIKRWAGAGNEQGEKALLTTVTSALLSFAGVSSLRMGKNHAKIREWVGRLAGPPRLRRRSIFKRPKKTTKKEVYTKGGILGHDLPGSPCRGKIPNLQPRGGKRKSWRISGCNSKGKKVTTLCQNASVCPLERAFANLQAAQKKKGERVGTPYGSDRGRVYPAGAPLQVRKADPSGVREAVHGLPFEKQNGRGSYLRKKII